MGCLLAKAGRWSYVSKPDTSMIGALAQLGERNTGSVEVSGSIPLGSTIEPDMLVSGHYRAAKSSSLALPVLTICLIAALRFSGAVFSPRY